MEVKALIRNVEEKENNGKKMAILTIETEKPLAIAQVRLFSNSVNDGTVNALKKAIGTKQLLPLSAEIYNGQIQFSFPFGESFHIAQPATTAAKAS